MAVDKDVQKKINRNNRKRGSKFEKVVADYLDMDVVPYSGSNKRFGFGDIRDSRWLGECKNITPSDGCITIKREWLLKNRERAIEANRIPFLAFMARGSADKYVMLDATTWLDIVIECSKLESVLMDQVKVSTLPWVLPRKVHNTTNFILPMDSMNIKRLRPKYGVGSIRVDGDVMPYYIMHIGMLKMLMRISGIKGTRSGDQA